MKINPVGYDGMTFIIENVTYVKHTGGVSGQFLEGITYAELNAGKTLTNDVVLGGFRGGAN